MATLLQLGAAALAFQGIAYAHYPVIAATVACSKGAPVISYTVTSWDPGTAGGSIASVDVLFNGMQVASASLVSTSTPPDEFSGSLPSPAMTNTVTVQAVPAFPYVWGDGETYSTPSNIVTLTIPASCASGTGTFTLSNGKMVDLDGDSVKSRFELPCDLSQPSTLEIVSGDNVFQMTDLTSAACTLQGSNPPNMPVNTISGAANGQWNGMDGYSVTFEVQDDGVPGKVDEVYFVVYQTSNPRNVVLWIPLQSIDSGNVQVKFDIGAGNKPS